MISLAALTAAALLVGGVVLCIPGFMVMFYDEAWVADI